MRRPLIACLIATLIAGCMVGPDYTRPLVDTPDAYRFPVIEQQIRQLENGISILLGRNPEPIQRGLTVATMGRPAVPSGVPSQLLAAPGHPPGRATPDRRQCPDRGGQISVFSEHLAHRGPRLVQFGAVRSVQRPGQHLELRRLSDRPFLRRRIGQRAGGSGPSPTTGGGGELPTSHPNRLRRCLQCADRPPEARRAPVKGKGPFAPALPQAPEILEQ